MKKFFTSESVTEGHPDKVCDCVSDAVLDAFLSVDPNARVACETTASPGLVLVMGEITANGNVDIEKIARDTVCEIGYDGERAGFDGNACKVIINVHKQSADIALGVDASLEKKNGGDETDTVGAGDQGMMFGYATDETEEKMPLTLVLAHKLTKRLTDVRKQGVLPYLLPDGKAQVTVEYDCGEPARVDAVVLSSQHAKNVDMEVLRADIKREVIEKVIPAKYLDENTKYFINPTGRIEISGPVGDTGLTGRKIIVDTYGGACPHGGGAFSGKDPTKVDRSAAYMARYVCKNLVAAGLCKEVMMEVAYAIGVAHPLSLFINTYGTGVLSDEAIAKIVETEFDLRPAAIIKTLNLRKPVFRQTAAYGHFGRDEFAWEKTDRVNDLKKYL